MTDLNTVTLIHLDDFLFEPAGDPDPAVLDGERDAKLEIPFVWGVTHYDPADFHPVRLIQVCEWSDGLEASPETEADFANGDLALTEQQRERFLCDCGDHDENDPGVTVVIRLIPEHLLTEVLGDRRASEIRLAQGLI